MMQMRLYFANRKTNELAAMKVQSLNTYGAKAKFEGWERISLKQYKRFKK